MSEFTDTLFEQCKTYADVAREAYAQGKDEGKRIAQMRVDELEDALEQALEYFEKNMDVIDGDYGVPAPDERMKLAMIIQAALGRRP